MSNRLLKVDTSKNVFLILPLQTHFSPDVLRLVKWQTSSSQMLGLKTWELSLIFFFFLSHPTSNLSANPLGISRAFLHFSPPPPLSQGLGPPSFLAGLMAVAS